MKEKDTDSWDLFNLACDKLTSKESSSCGLIINTYNLEKLMLDALKKAFKQVEKELENYNWEFISKYTTINNNEKQ